MIIFLCNIKDFFFEDNHHERAYGLSQHAPRAHHKNAQLYDLFRLVLCLQTFFYSQ
jgi:hypothetical protein